MKIIEKIKQTVADLQVKPVIIYPEGWNKTIQAAAVKLKETNHIEPILIFKTSLQASEFNNHLNIKTFIIETNDVSKYATLLYELRKEKGMDLQTANKLVKEPNFLACLMLKEYKDTPICAGVVCGIEYTTKDTLKPALQIIKPKKGVKVVSSIMIFERNDKTVYMSDIGLTINPNATELSFIIKNSVDFVYNTVGEKNVNCALLSYSTNGSAGGESAEKVKTAYALYNENYAKEFSDVNVYGEIQFDAAVDEKIRAKKAPNSTLKDNANLFVVPNLDAGNIGYKMLQRFGNFEVTGPIIVGLDLPVNDLSRGANEYEVISLSYVCALQAKK